MGNGKCGQMVIMVNTEDREGVPWGMGTGVMGHMANWAHGQRDTWAMGHGQRGIMVNIKDRDGVPWGMGHMGDGAHGQWGTWAIGHMIITSLILHGSLQKFYCT